MFHSVVYADALSGLQGLTSFVQYEAILFSDFLKVFIQ